MKLPFSWNDALKRAQDLQPALFPVALTVETLQKIISAHCILAHVAPSEVSVATRILAPDSRVELEIVCNGAVALHRSGHSISEVQLGILDFYFTELSQLSRCIRDLLILFEGYSKISAQEHRIVLSEESWTNVIEQLENPPEPTDAMRKLFHHDD